MTLTGVLGGQPLDCALSGISIPEVDRPDHRILVRAGIIQNTMDNK